MPALDEETFIRRIYLDIAGRIPTYWEYQQFMKMPAKTRRSDIIDKLMDSPAYVSHFYNYWVDTLRATTWMKKSDGGPYLHWIKKSIADNKPYNQFVYELVSAEGPLYKPGNGAAGYYLRDYRMPLDNVASTMQVFLATSMVCAQCHDHPYNDWTQMDFYKIAAFTHGTETNAKNVDIHTVAKIQDHLNNSSSRKSQKGKLNDTPLRPLFFGTYNSGAGKIKLPSDYNYDDGKPNELVHAGVPFSPKVKINYNSSNGATARPYKFKFDKKNTTTQVNSRKHFAKWIVSPENPMFTKTIVNRLWHRIMGAPLIGENLDITPEEFGKNPALTKYLIKIMQGLKYDQKMFMKIIYKSRIYQRKSHDQVPEDYLFSGPIMTRLSAEQIWDSLITIRTKTPDSGLGVPDKVIAHYIYENLASKSVAEKAEYMKNSKSEIKKIEKNLKPNQNFGRYSKRRKLVRASEGRSPAESGSMLHIFGQSSREVTDDSKKEANIPQALALLNDDQFSFNKISTYDLIQQKSDKEKQLELIYLSLLSRKPNEHDLNVFKQAIDNGFTIDDFYWALLNSLEFKLKR